MLLAIFAIVPVGNKTLSSLINMNIPLGKIGSVIFFGLIIGSIFYFTKTKNKSQVNE